MITFNRVDLSNRINVTSITGRGPLSQNAIRSKVPGKVGSYYQSREVPERIISVGIEIPGDSLEDIRQKVDELNGILSTEFEVPIVFSDEPTKTYYGILDGQPNWEEIVFIGKGTISLLCTDPCKYGQEKSESFINDTLTLVNNGTANTKPILSATFTTAASEFKVTHSQSGKYVRIIRNFLIGDMLEIDFNTEKVTINGTVAMTSLDWISSDFFSLNPGVNTLTIDPVGIVNAGITIKERWL